MSTQLEQLPTDRQVDHFKDRLSQNKNISCEFESLPREQQLKIARELSKVNHPGLEIKYEASNPQFLDVTVIQDGKIQECKFDPKQGGGAKSDSSVDPVEAEVQRRYQEMLKEQQPRIDAERAAQYQKDHDPQEIAKKIEDAATRDIKNDDEGAKLEVRRKLEALKNETPEVQQKVLQILEKDGSSWNPLNPIPKADVQYAKDANGNEIPSQPISIEFSSIYSWRGADTVPLNKTVQEQAKDAEQNYYTKTVPNAGITMAGPIAEHEQRKRDGTLPEDKKLWWERVQPVN